MKNYLLKLLSGVTMALFTFTFAWADDYIAIAKDGNVYDESNAKYITVNQNNEDVAVIPGMVFSTTQHTPGWYKVEYSPGLHAFIPDQIAATNFKPVAAGSYEIKNNPGKKLEASVNGDAWTAIVDGKSFKGKKFEEIILFVDPSNNIAYSLVDIGSGPIAITYDNNVTKFF